MVCRTGHAFLLKVIKIHTITKWKILRFCLTNLFYHYEENKSTIKILKKIENFFKKV